MAPFDLAVLIWMYLNLRANDEHISVPEIFLNFTEDIHSEDILGTLHIKDLYVSGLDTMSIDINNIVGTEDEDGNNDVCLHLPIGNLQLTTEYVADIGIANEIPIYGDGRILVSMDNIVLNICAFFNFVENRAEVISTSTTYRHKPIEFTGLWKNVEASALLEDLLNIANIFYAMWSAYEPERAGCIFTPFIQYGINNYLETKDNTFTFNTTCLRELFKDNTQLSDYEHLEEYLRTKVSRQKTDNISKILDDNESRTVVSKIMSILFQSIKKITTDDKS